MRKTRATFSGPSIQTKRTILSALGSNLLLKDKKLHVDVDSALIPIKLIAFPVISKVERLEPQVVTINKGRTQSFDQVRPMWLSGRVVDQFSKGFSGLFWDTVQARGSAVLAAVP